MTATFTAFCRTIGIQKLLAIEGFRVTYPIAGFNDFRLDFFRLWTDRRASSLQLLRMHQTPRRQPPAAPATGGSPTTRLASLTSTHDRWGLFERPVGNVGDGQLFIRTRCG